MITDNQMQKTLMKESFDYLNKFIALICFFTGLKKLSLQTSDKLSNGWQWLHSQAAWTTLAPLEG